MKNQYAPALSSVLFIHMLRMSAATCKESADAYLDLGRELRFFVMAGYHRHLAKDKEFVKRWKAYTSGAASRELGPDVVFQDWKFEEEMELMALACAIYEEQGLLAPSATPWDLPQGEGAEVPAGG